MAGSRQRGSRAKVLLVHIEKATIVRHLREHGRHEDAIRADRELPDRIHTTQDVELFEPSVSIPPGSKARRLETGHRKTFDFSQHADPRDEQRCDHRFRSKWRIATTKAQPACSECDAVRAVLLPIQPRPKARSETDLENHEQ